MVKRLDLDILESVIGRKVTEDEADHLMFVRGLQLVVNEIMDLAIADLVTLYVDSDGAIRVIGAQGDPIRLAELVREGVLEDDGVSLFPENGSYGTGGSSDALSEEDKKILY